MGWPWVCFRIRDISARKIRDAEGRGSCGSYDTKLISLAAQFDCSKTPPTQESGTPTTYAVSSTSSRCADGNGSEKEGSSLAYQEARLRPHVVNKRQGNTYETLLNNSAKGPYGSRWDNGEDTQGECCVSRAPSSSRKSFSELLIETNTLEFSTSRVKGPLAMAAMAAAAERAASSRRLQEEGEGGRSNSWPKHLEANEHTPLSPQSSHSMLLQSAASTSSFSKQHLEASQAVGDFKENRRRLMSERASNGRANVRIRSLFRSSRKRSLLLRSHLFRRTLSPVPEALSLDEELQSKRQSNVDLPDFFIGDLQQALGGCGDNDSKDLIPSTRIHRRDEERYFLALSEKASTVTSESPLTEKWDDHVHVEELHEIPPQTEQENPGGAGASPAPPLCSPGSFMRFGIGRREEIVRDGGLLDDDITTNCILYKGLDMSACSSGGAFHEKTPFFWENSASRDQAPISNLHREHDERQDDDKLLKTPVRGVLVAPESFISPKTTDLERKFTRLMDMEPVERPIFGSLADYWGTACATERSAWDGQGIPNSTDKYREDEKVMWHSAPFEERLVKALESQQNSVPLRRNRLRGQASQLATGSSERLQAHWASPD